jgi:6-phosphogluconolactonase (cycloisomerase 2 family)
MKVNRHTYATVALLMCGLLLIARTAFASPAGFVYLLGGFDDSKAFQFLQTADGDITLARPPDVQTGKGVVAAAITPSGSFFYTLNDAESTISEFHINGDGLLKPLRNKATASPKAYKLFISRDGRYFYELDTDGASIFSFKIGLDGQLRRLPFVTTTEKLPLNMTFDSTGRFAYVICGDGSDPQSGSNTIDEFRVNKNGSFSPLKPWVIEAGYWAGQLFASTTEPYVYLPDQAGLTEYRVSVTGQLVEPKSTPPSTSFSQVFGVFDEQLGCVVSTATQEDGQGGFPDELVVTKVTSGKTLEVGQMYAPDDTGTLEAGLNSERGENAAFASLVLDPKKHIVYAIDAQSFKIFRYRVNADATLTQLLPSGITGHAPSRRTNLTCFCRTLILMPSVITCSSFLRSSSSYVK